MPDVARAFCLACRDTRIYKHQDMLQCYAWGTSLQMTHGTSTMARVITLFIMKTDESRESALGHAAGGTLVLLGQVMKGRSLHCTCMG